jgi:hypothetical protein
MLQYKIQARYLVFPVKTVVFLADSLYAETIKATIMCCFISYIRRANLDIWRYEFRGGTLKQISVCQFLNWI